MVYQQYPALINYVSSNTKINLIMDVGHMRTL